MEKSISEKPVFVLIFLITILAGMQLNLMDIDATQYALISKEMFFNKSYLEIFCRGRDYLDKPPMLFWTSVLSFKVFGIHEWSYRLPSVLVSILGLISLFNFTKLYYNNQISLYSALIFASSQAFFLMNHDVRTDTMLSGFVLFAIWQIASYFKTKIFWSLIMGTIGIGFAMMTKGPIGLIGPIIIIGINLIYEKKLNLLFDTKILYTFLLLLILLIPMSYGLYIQFDLHPEKEVYGLKGPSGLRFYYWIQSFGRITNESNWDNNPEPLFLVHSFLWSFLPWSILYVLSLIKIIKVIINKELKAYQPEISSIGGFFILFIIMSFSSYQLPHYTFFIHPLASIILANYLSKIQTNFKTMNALSIVQAISFIVISALVFYLCGWAFPENPFLFNSITIIALIYSVVILFYCESIKQERLIWSGLFFMSMVNFTLNIQIYPSIFKYQANQKIAEQMNKNNPQDPLFIYETDYWFSCDFKLNQNIKYENNLDSLINKSEKKKIFIMTNENGLTKLKENIKIDDFTTFQNYPVSNLSLDFINPYKRNQTISYLYLVETK
jgi:4-amino-4-deoxy-L-arabinose transferase-like glycosyltransferase